MLDSAAEIEEHQFIPSSSNNRSPLHQNTKEPENGFFLLQLGESDAKKRKRSESPWKEWTYACSHSFTAQHTRGFNGTITILFHYIFLQRQDIRNIIFVMPRIGKKLWTYMFSFCCTSWNILEHKHLFAMKRPNSHIIFILFATIHWILDMKGTHKHQCNDACSYCIKLY